MAKDDSGLLIAALVAIVAVVGLVILFSGAQASGAVVKHSGTQQLSMPADMVSSAELCSMRCQSSDGSMDWNCHNACMN